jgi:hypothetical protein
MSGYPSRARRDALLEIGRQVRGLKLRQRVSKRVQRRLNDPYGIRALHGNGPPILIESPTAL